MHLNQMQVQMQMRMNQMQMQVKMQRSQGNQMQVHLSTSLTHGAWTLITCKGDAHENIMHIILFMFSRQTCQIFYRKND